MGSLPWLEAVRKRLFRHGLPPTYVQRFVTELADHFHDLKEETMSASADVFSRLGEPAQVADAAVVAYRRRSLLGRHPAAAILVFGLSPIGLLLLFAALCAGAALGIDEACNWMGWDTAQGLRSLEPFDPAASLLMTYGLSMLIVVIPSILASILYCKLAARLGIGKAWVLLSGAVLATVALMPICSAHLSNIPGQCRLAVGTWDPVHFDLGALAWCLSSPQQLLQCIAPLLVAGWFVRRRSDGRLQLAS